MPYIVLKGTVHPMADSRRMKGAQIKGFLDDCPPGGGGCRRKAGNGKEEARIPLANS